MYSCINVPDIDFRLYGEDIINNARNEKYKVYKTPTYFMWDGTVYVVRLTI